MLGICQSRTCEPQTGRVKLRISPATGEAKFPLGEGKIHGWVLLGVLQRGI